MTRRSFFSLLAAPVVAPMVPKPTHVVKPASLGGYWIPPRQYVFSEPLVLNQSVTLDIPLHAWPDLEMKTTARAIIDAINKEVRGGSLLIATQLKK